VTRVVPRTPCPFHARIAAPHLRSPVMVIAPQDEMPHANPDVCVHAALPGPKELLEISGGHFELLHHPSDLFEQASQALVDFLLRTL
jgi:uncharacterized protein